MPALPSVVIHSIEVQPVEFRGQRVLTFAQIDKLHGRPEGTARKRFNDNESRMVVEEDFYRIDFSQKSVFRTFGIEIPPRGLTVVTESGYLLLVKSFTDDLAWAVQKELVKTYFRAKALEQPAPAPTFERINSADVAALEAIVHRIKYNFRHQDMAAHAIYSGIRRVYGLEHSVKNLPTCYFHDVLNLLAEVERVSRLFQGMALDLEKRFFHRVLRPMLPFDEQEWQLNLDKEFSQIEAHHDRTLQLIANYQSIN